MLAELLGILLALWIAGLVWGLVRLWRLLRSWGARPLLRVPAERIRARRMRAARGLAHAQAERIAALTKELERTRLRLRQAERARAAAPLTAAAARWEERFQRAKRAFALRFHPDRLRAATPRAERNLRISMFREYWSELQRIERG
jgi:hypothetical protein